MNGVKELREEDFQGDVLGADVPVLADFFAAWCGPCRALAPALEDIAAKYKDRIKVVKVNVDDCPNLAHRYGIRGVPTLMIFSDGQVVDTVVGLPALSVLRQKLEAAAAAKVQAGAA